MFGDGAEFGRREQQDISHHADIGLEFSEGGLGLIGRILWKAVYWELSFLGSGHQRVGPRPGPIRGGKHARDLVAARDKGVERRFAKSLLADDDDAHFTPSDCGAVRRQGSTLGGPAASPQRRQ